MSINKELCPHCWGSGWETQLITPCTHCKGSGEVRMETLTTDEPTDPDYWEQREAEECFEPFIEDKYL